MRRRIRYAAVLMIAMLAAAGCGEDPTGSASSGAGSNGGGGASLKITSPANGASVTVPFMLKFDSSVQLGPPESGRDHVHVFSDGKTDKYTVVPGNTFEIKDLGPGQHTVGVTLQHADHSSAGASTEVTVMVTGSGGAPGAGEETDTGYGY